MELKKEEAENVKFAYENEKMPNPNDTLFGNLGNNLGGDFGGHGNNISGDNSDYSEIKPKKSIPSWVWIVVPIIALAIIGIFAVKMLGGKSIDGAYIAKSVIVDGKEYTMDYFEEATGMEFYMRLEIDGKEGYLVMSFGGMVDDGNINIDVDGSDIHVSKGDVELLFKYDKKTGTISYEKDGTKLIFEKIADM